MAYSNMYAVLAGVKKCRQGSLWKDAVLVGFVLGLATCWNDAMVACAARSSVAATCSFSSAAASDAELFS
jgi:uncharacterized membrane protein